jgi:hypothetical protein
VQEPLDIEGRLDPEDVVVLFSVDGELLFTDPNLQILHTVALTSNDTAVSISGGYAAYLDTDETDGQGVTLVAAEGASLFTPAPASGGDLVAWRLSPDGSRLAWLFDVTEVRPSMVDGCDPNAGCVGLIYDLFLTDNMGGQAEMVWNHVIDSPAGVGGMELINWRDDSMAVFLGIDPGDLGPFYPPGYDTVFEVVVSEEIEIRERSQGYVATEEMVISRDGRWLAVAGGPESLSVESDDGRLYSVPYVVYPNPYTAQLAFSPSSELLAWVELTTPELELSVESLALNVMSMQTGEVLTVVDFEVDLPSLPLVGPWLTDDLLIVFFAGQSWVIDVVNAQAGAWPPQLDGVTSVRVLGVIH